MEVVFSKDKPSDHISNTLEFSDQSEYIVQVDHQCNSVHKKHLAEGKAGKMPQARKIPLASTRTSCLCKPYSPLFSPFF